MKILLCTPYRDAPDIVRGGINQWGQNILAYYEKNKGDIELVPISFDRHISLNYANTTIQRVINGFREQITPIRKAKRAMIEEKPDVVHICTSAGMGCLRDFLLVIFFICYNIRTIIHLHFGRLPDLVNKRNWEWFLLKYVIKMCDVVIPMNRPTEVALLENNFNNVKYLPNPLSNSITEQISNLEGQIKRIPKQILYVGHVYETKGVVELVEGCRDIEGINLRIVGKYTQEIYDKLISIGVKSNKTNCIGFVGEIPHEDVLKEFLRADLFVFPSYTEGFPNVILEAMACGCPIIASNVGAIPEMLDIYNEPCGICIQSHSSEEVHDAIIMLLCDSQKKKIFAERAKLRVNSLYAMSVVWKELVSIWNV